METSTSCILTTAALNSCLKGKFPYPLETYNLSTTGIIARSLISKCRNINIIEFDSFEMESFLNYYQHNQELIKIGFNDSSAIYYSSASHMPLIIGDVITETICQKLNIKYILLNAMCKQTNASQQHQPRVINESSNPSRNVGPMLDSQPYNAITNNIPLMTG